MTEKQPVKFYGSYGHTIKKDIKRITKLAEQTAGEPLLITEAKDVKIPVEHEGILEIPKDKKFYELPISHFEKLVKKNGYKEVIAALRNQEVWHKNHHKEIGVKAKEIMNKLKEKHDKEKPKHEADISTPEGKQQLQNMIKLYRDSIEYLEKECVRCKSALDTIEQNPEDPELIYNNLVDISGTIITDSDPQLSSALEDVLGA